MHAAQDPLYLAIAAFKDGCRRFNALPFPEGAEEEDATIAATYGQPMQELAEWSRPAMSLQGAIDALQLAVDETCFVDDMGEAMVRAVLAYLKNQQHAGSN